MRSGEVVRAAGETTVVCHTARRRCRRATKACPARGCPLRRHCGSAESGRWHGPCRSRRTDGTERTRSDGRPSCGWATGRVWSHKRGSPNGLASPYAHRPDVALTNPVLPSGRKLPPGADGPARRGSEDRRSSVITKRPRRFERPHGGILALQRGEDVNSPYTTSGSGPTAPAGSVGGIGIRRTSDGLTLTPRRAQGVRRRRTFRATIATSSRTSPNGNDQRNPGGAK